MEKFKNISVDIQQLEDYIEQVESNMDNLEGEEYKDAEGKLLTLKEELKELRNTN